MPFGIGIWEILILLLVILLVFGPKRLPEMGKSLGKGMREFKDSIQGKDDDDEEPRRAELPAVDHTAAGPQTTAAAPAPREHDPLS